MLLNQLLTFLTEYWPHVLVASLTVFLLNNKFYKGLNKYPGPRLAGYTNWWRFWDAYKRKPELTHVKLHRQYGDIVRLGPNVLSFADPQAIKDIYGLNKGFVKSDFYPIQQATAKGRRLISMFSTTDEGYHARYRRCVNNAFAMSSLVSYEPLVDSTLKVFLDKTENFYAENSSQCDFARWLQFFAFDVIGDLTWSQRLGFVERNEDVDGIVGFLGRFLSYAGLVGQMPILDLLLEKNPLKLLAEKYSFSKTVFPVTAFALARSQERTPELARIKASGLPKTSQTGGVDLLTKFAAAQFAHPQTMTDQLVLTTCVSMIFAGSETTAITLSAIFYFLLTHPEAYRKLMAELDAAAVEGSIPATGPVSWSAAQKLPYLDAVIQESFRLHPAAGLLLERVVPPQGATICGEHIPGGVIVGCNAWVLHRQKRIFGDDVDEFRPERWLEASPNHLREMKASMFQFGAGSRTCLGKNISLLEIYKAIPSFLRRFEIELCNSKNPWSTHNGWFVRQLGFNVTFRPRKAVDVSSA